MNIKITDKWDSYLERFNPENCDIYYTENYVKLYQDEDHKALCVICEDEDKILLMPFLRGRIQNYFDFETPYGYGGPITNDIDDLWIIAALSNVKQYFHDQNYTCGFIRFHPLLMNSAYCSHNIQVIKDRQTIAIDTKQPEEEIWAKQIISKNRNVIRKAEKNSLEYKAEYDFASIDEFIKLYNQTMKRLDADAFYFFDDNYYKMFVDGLKGKAFLGTVRKDGQLICGALFMYSKLYGHYHLEGSDHQFSSLAANNYLLWKTACEMHRMGISEFHLGGGYDATPDNKLYKFKHAFSDNVKEFDIGKWIFNEDAYTEIVKQWKQSNPEKAELYGNRLLCYRY